MSSFHRLLLSSLLPVLFLSGPYLHAQQETKPATPASDAMWSSDDATHAFGFPEVKAKKKGLLSLDEDNLTFIYKASRASIPRNEITAVSAGNDRIELWGTGGMILRMAIPQGGGLAAAAIMHHRVDMLTVEFVDPRGGQHSAVFYLPGDEAKKALKAFVRVPYAAPAPQISSCGTNPVEAGSVLVETPEWGMINVPAAYRSLVYEHLFDRLRTAKGISHVYRQGEINTGSACPQYVIHITIKVFKQGNQVIRASTGPIGFFASPTQVTFDVRFTDHAHMLDVQQQIKATVRDQSESTNVADKFAKTTTRHYLKALQKAQEAASAPAPSPKEKS